MFVKVQALWLSHLSVTSSLPSGCDYDDEIVIANFHTGVSLSNSVLNVCHINYLLYFSRPYKVDMISSILQMSYQRNIDQSLPARIQPRSFF